MNYSGCEGAWNGNILRHCMDLISCYLVICDVPVLCDDGAKNLLRYLSSIAI
jgi:hypothetical protein